MEVLRYAWKHKSLIVLILLYSCLSLSFIIGNGDYRCNQLGCGLFIGGWHLHDAMWHLALTKVAFNSFPFVHPEMSGSYLTGYNYFLDIIIYGLTKIGLPSLFVFFKLLPVIFIPFYSYLLILIGLKFNQSIKYIWSLLFFMFFGSSFTYLIPLFKDHNFYYSAMKGFPVVTSIQPSLVFLNLQFGYSLLAIILILISLKSGRGIMRSLILGVLVFVSASLKFYAGAVAISLIYLYEFFDVFSHKKIISFFSTIFTTTIFLALSYFLFYKTNSESLKSPFVFVPFALTHLMIEDVLLFYNKNMVNARYFLYANGVSPRLILIEGYSIILFLLVNFGTRLIMLFTLPIQVITRKLDSLKVSMLITILLCTLMPILFIQDGGWYNTMQFLYYGVFLSSFFAADLLTQLLKSKKILNYLLVGIIIILTLPNNVEQIRYAYEPQQMISDKELAGLNFLSLQPKGSVFATNSYKKTGYISALSGQQTYFADVDQLMVTHLNYLAREKIVLNPSSIAPESLEVKYWYLLQADSESAQILPKLRDNPNFSSIFSNEAVTIYAKVDSL